MPVPPARSRSARVPCGVSSTSSSPERQRRASSLVPPTNELIVRLIRPAYNSTPSAWSSTPQLFEIDVRLRAPCSRIASISAMGTPQSPKPPTASVAPSEMSATASWVVAPTLSNTCSLGSGMRGGQYPCPGPVRRCAVTTGRNGSGEPHREAWRCAGMELTCPKCHGMMRTYERNGVHVDQCADCRGIFLDRGELDRLIDAENAWHGGP